MDFNGGETHVATFSGQPGHFGPSSRIPAQDFQKLHGKCFSASALSWSKRW